MSSGYESNFTQKIMSLCSNEDDVAYIYGDVCVSYKDLFRQTKLLASGMKEKGIKNRDRVIVALFDTPAFVETFLAAIAIGAIPIPVNPMLKPESLLHVIEDSGAGYIVTERNEVSLNNLDDCLSKTENDVVVLYQDIFSLNSDVKIKPNLDVGKLLSTLLLCNSEFEFEFNSVEDDCFWQYTSGTTGLPKAVRHASEGMITHANLYGRKTLGLGKDDVFFSAAKMYFGYGLGASLIIPLCLGASTVLKSETPITDISTLGVLTKHKPTVFFGVPSIYAALLPHYERIQEIFSCVRCCVSAGSPLPGSVFLGWKEKLKQNIYDGIGATEVGHIFLGSSEGNLKAGATGKPISGYQVRLKKRAEDDNAKENEGVLCVKGPSVSMGYWNNENKTAEKFEGGWYCTGDIYKVDEDGFYHFLGREDDLFKVNGMWVEPLHIEMMIADKFDYILECALVRSESVMGLVKSQFFIVSSDPEKEAKEITSDINMFFHNNFEKHIRPEKVSVIEKMPRNDNGKVVRGQLC